jgi:hypothetical protein
MLVVKGSHDLGPVILSASGLMGTGNPPGQVIDREYGLSVGVEARLPDFR